MTTLAMLPRLDVTGGPSSTAPQDALAAAEELIVTWMPLARSIAYEYLARAPRHVDRDDVISAAFLGLVEAAHRYDPANPVPFARYAPLRIRGAIADSARAADPLSKQARRDVKVVRAAEDILAQSSGGDVSDDQLASQLGWNVSAIREARTQFHRAVTTSLDAVTAGPESESFAVRLVDADPTPLERLERAELDHYMADAVHMLPERLQDVLRAYYFENESSADTAERMGLTQQRVGQLRKEALTMLREGISAQYAEVYQRTAVAPLVQAPSSSPAGARQAARVATFAAAVAARSTYAERLSL